MQVDVKKQDTRVYLELVGDIRSESDVAALTEKISLQKDVPIRLNWKGVEAGNSVGLMHLIRILNAAPPLVHVEVNDTVLQLIGSRVDFLKTADSVESVYLSFLGENGKYSERLYSASKLVELGISGVESLSYKESGVLYSLDMDVKESLGFLFARVLK